MRKLFFFALAALTLSLASCGDGNAPDYVYLSVNAPEGAIKGVFSVGENTKVYFSKGNLQYKYYYMYTLQGDGDWQGFWCFADNQWESLGVAKNLMIGKPIAKNDMLHIDLFGWATRDNPTNYSMDDEDYPKESLDWGDNPITNGGNKEKQWRTLSADEWAYLIHRDNDQKFGLGTVNDVKGMIILPDNWQMPAKVTKVFHASVKNGLKLEEDGAFYNNDENNYEHNTFAGDEWNAMEDNGALFLPIAGARCSNTYIFEPDVLGDYWTSTINDGTALYFAFNDYFVNPKDESTELGWGTSVRLVQDIK